MTSYYAILHILNHDLGIKHNLASIDVVGAHAQALTTMAASFAKVWRPQSYHAHALIHLSSKEDITARLLCPFYLMPLILFKQRYQYY